MSSTQDILNRIPRKAARKLETLLQSKQLSEDGLRFIINAADPFSDIKVEQVGYPDTSSSNTVVYLVTEQTTIAPPTGLGPTD